LERNWKLPADAGGFGLAGDLRYNPGHYGETKTQEVDGKEG
jgi:hypothetical protein